MLLEFKTEKYNIMHFGNNMHLTYEMKEVDGTYAELEKTTLEKDLGLFVGNKLSFLLNVCTAVKKAKRNLGLIKQTFHNKSDFIIRNYLQELFDHCWNNGMC